MTVRFSHYLTGNSYIITTGVHYHNGMHRIKVILGKA